MITFIPDLSPRMVKNSRTLVFITSIVEKLRRKTLVAFCEHYAPNCISPKVNGEKISAQLPYLENLSDDLIVPQLYKPHFTPLLWLDLQRSERIVTQRDFARDVLPEPNFALQKILREVQLPFLGHSR